MSKGKSTEPKDKSRTLYVEKNPKKSQDAIMAESATGGILNNALLIADFSKTSIGEISLTECIVALSKKSKDVHEGKLDDVETMLMAQAVALDSIFSSMAIRARLNMGEYMNAAEKYLRLALKAQAQSRVTLEALANIKNPKPYIQNNQAHYQQVNNGAAHTVPDTEEKTKGTNRLLEDKTHEQQWLDTGTPRTASESHKELETMDA